MFLHPTGMYGLAKKHSLGIHASGILLF